MTVQTIETKQVNIIMEQGASFWMSFTVRDDDDNLVSLVGTTVVAQLREYAEASDYIQFTATHNGSGGRVTITMPHEETANIPYTSGVYDVFIYYANGTRDKCIEGDVTITPAVTKPVAGEIIYLLSFAKEEDFPNTGMVRRIYFSHATNHMYRWNGTAYVSITTDGEAATVEVGDVTTLTAGSDATVENVGSLLNAVFDFGIPEGNGIASIELDSTSGLEKTYRVTFTDPSVDDFTFVVMDGAKGDPGTTTWEGITNKPSTFPPSSHNHDDRYYTETEVDSLLGAKADASAVYTVTEANALLALKADASDVYSKSATDDLLDAKADASDVYDKSDVDSLLSAKADTSDLGDLAYEDDAPSDNKPYARKNGEWAEITGGGGGDAVWGSITGTLSDQTDLANALQNKADVIVSSASGSVASFPDGMSAPVVGLSVGVEPVQDLHGQSSPYPGGGGVNKWDGDNELGSINSTTGENNTDGTRSRSGFIPALPESEYRIFAVDRIPMTFGFYFYRSDKTYISYVSKAKGSTFITPSDTYFMRFVIGGSQNPITSIDANEISINYPSSVTTYVPYSNICPISGHSSATVTRTGGNAWDEEYLQGYYSSSGVYTETNTQLCTKNLIPVKPNATYYIKIGSNAVGVNTASSVLWYDKNGTFIERVSQYVGTFTVPSNARYMKFNFGSVYGGTYNNDISINYPSTDTAYHAYSGTSVTIPFGSTVYDGMLDVVNGALRVTHTEFSVTKDTPKRSTSMYEDTVFTVRYTLTDMPKSGYIANECYCNALYPDQGTGAFAPNYTPGSFSPYISNGNAILGIGAPLSVQNVTDFNAMLENIGTLKFYHPLATPIEVTLTPSVISTLLGQNVIWADTGDCAVQYRADTKAYIDKVVSQTALTTRAMIADSATADGKAPKSLASGDLIIVGNELRKCTSNIGSGSAITASNSTVATLADVIKALQ